VGFIYVYRPHDHIIAERKEHKINQRFIESSHVLEKILYEIIESCNSTTTYTMFLTKIELHRATHIDYGQFGSSLYKILGSPLHGMESTL